MKSIKPKDQLIQEAIINDLELNRLRALLLKYHTLVIPRMVLTTDNKVKCFWDENETQIKEIESLILFRTEQITNYYNSQF